MTENTKMTPEQADVLYLQLRAMSLSQLFALWRLIYLIIGQRLDRGEGQP